MFFSEEGKHKRKNMKLLFRQRVFSWFDSYDIYDEQGNTMFTVKGVLSWGHCLKIFDAYDREIGMIQEKVFTFLPKFLLYIGEKEVGEIAKEFTFFFPKFHLDCNGWEIEGDILEWDYMVKEGVRTVMTASKKIWNFTDTYELNIERPEDALYCVMIVLAIDAAKCSKN